MLGQLGHYLGRTRHSWLFFYTGILQTILAFVAATLRKGVATDTASSTRLTVIFILAFVSGVQVAMAQTVNVPEITTAMVTSAYIDRFVDLELLVDSYRSRSRRLFVLLTLLMGSFTRTVGTGKSGLLSHSLSEGPTGICVMLLFSHAEIRDGVEREAHEAVPQAANLR